MPVAEPFQGVQPAVVELEPGAGDEVFDRTRDQHLAGGRLTRDAGTGVDRHASDFSVDELAFACV